MKISQSATGMTIEQVAERCKELADALESMEVPGDPNAPDGIMVSAETPMNIASHLRAAVQAIAAAEARGEERMREKAAKCAARTREIIMAIAATTIGVFLVVDLIRGAMTGEWNL